MKYSNVIIKSVSIYHPATKVTNEEIINHFNKQDIEITGLLNHLGRDIRYKASEDENSLSMGYEAGKKIFDNSNVKPRDIDLLYFVSDTPEYLVPTNALRLHNMLGTVNANINADINSNCIGMLSALDMVQTFMKSKKLLYGLVIGSVNLLNISRPDDTVAYGSFGDGACAVLLELVDSNKEFGFINSNYFTDSALNHYIQYPICGTSNVCNVDLDRLNKKLQFIPHDVSFFSNRWKDLILNMLFLNKVNITDIDHFMFSQFCKAEIAETLEKLNTPFEKTTFIGDKYGYTGCTSPIFSYYHALLDNRIVADKYNVFCSVGAGYNMCALLYKNTEGIKVL